ncbi:MAG: LysR family transcriptional regulator [Burkholderiaceae bacterium]|nr:LysR family transcriptional regulator [Burkholderiales bacterium]MCZ8341315.1 LysR family transcriptional regulator [Burkholderiaceae bacterium]
MHRSAPRQRREHAARTLGLSRAAVSAQIARLERDLHARLLERTTRRVALTDEGRLYHARAVRIL